MDKSSTGFELNLYFPIFIISLYTRIMHLVYSYKKVEFLILFSKLRYKRFCYFNSITFYCLDFMFLQCYLNSLII